MAGARRSLWLVNGLIVLVVLLAAGGTVYALTGSGGTADQGLRTTPVGRGTVTQTVTASGAVTSARGSTLNFASSGRVEDVRVKLGDTVTAGEIVATLDPEYADANLDAARAQRDSARQQLADAREARDNPTTTAATQAPAAGAQAGGTTGTATGNQPGAVTQPGAAQPAQPAAPAQPGQAQPAPGQSQPHPAQQQPQQQGAPLVEINRFSSGAAAQPQAADPTPTPTPGAGSGSTGTSGGSAGAGGGAATTPEGQVASAEASLAQAEASVIQAEQSAENLELSSPQDGTVVSLDIGPGQLVPAGGTTSSSTTSGNPTGGTLPDGTAAGGGAAASSGASGGSAASSGAAAGGGSGAASGGGTTVTGTPTTPAAMTVLDLSSLQIRADVPELDVGRLAAGQAVAVSVNALPGQSLPGVVSSVDLLPGTGTSVQYGTNVALTGLPPNLRPGMSASVAVDVAQAPNVLFLPSAAITPTGGAGATSGTVQVLGPDGVPQARTVGLGLSSDTTTEIRSGLAPGELVVLPGATAEIVPGQGPPGQQRNGGNGGNGGGNRSGGGGGG
ncbi:hypothetical protein Acsp06_48350 [Actinomycetospora sp. NBRC 106375]|uniref:efflux RND transporter periplasmic adaptor subunit n=1 Tax=Actinomycetospora sp. NBRC 106375 TaxID=3032207 RepID=UPI0024A42E44|nr:HlyD family efflux transporter periplasmic adaptor subunit [Actinomycetospora sp. NBRC 106375]GLZ48650.1 hypothetical protein Acsp06_48350 [Actinomycetospora sp. NBRC 106375]